MFKHQLFMKKLVLFLFLASSVGLSIAQEINPKNIQIARDKWGVPHIFGKTDAEVAYGLAWAHSEDDFATIQTSYLAGKGMLGLLKGKQGAQIDYVVQLFRAKELVEAKKTSAHNIRRYYWAMLKVLMPTLKLIKKTFWFPNCFQLRQKICWPFRFCS